MWPLCYLLPPTEGSQEHSDLSSALAQIRDIIAAVDLTVNKYERCQELQEVLARLENKSFAKLKNGKEFRKQDLHSKHRDLQYKGLVYWKTATGRLKGLYKIICVAQSLTLRDNQSTWISAIVFSDTLALLLTDVLVFLQEKDQRFVFAAVVSLDLKNTLKSKKPCSALHPLTHFYGFCLLSGPEASCNPSTEAHC